MKLLCLDTAMAACSVGVYDATGERLLASAYVPMERGHAEALAPMVEQVMREAGLGFGDLGRIAVTVGPGTFTGVRIGLAMARGLGLALGIPVCGIDTLTAIACNQFIISLTHKLLSCYCVHFSSCNYNLVFWIRR